jgi:hypothetical protein
LRCSACVQLITVAFADLDAIANQVGFIKFSNQMEEIGAKKEKREKAAEKIVNGDISS